MSKEFGWPDFEANGDSIDTNHVENFIKFERWSTEEISANNQFVWTEIF